MDVVLGCMGIGGDEVLPQEAIDALADLAEDVHRRASWSSPCCPFDLARSEGIALIRANMAAYALDHAFYCGASDRRDEGLAVGLAIASVLLLRRRRYTPLRAAALAAELLVPEWSLSVEHLWAPMWLLRVRSRFLRAA